MEGSALAAKDRYDIAIVTAWNTAMFALSGYGGKLKGKKLSDFLSAEPDAKQSKASEAIAFFHNLKARGVPVQITRLN